MKALLLRIVSATECRSADHLVEWLRSAVTQLSWPQRNTLIRFRNALSVALDEAGPPQSPTTGKDVLAAAPTSQADAP